MFRVCLGMLRMSDVRYCSGRWQFLSHAFSPVLRTPPRLIYTYQIVNFPPCCYLLLNLQLKLISLCILPETFHLFPFILHYNRKGLPLSLSPRSFFLDSKTKCIPSHYSHCSSLSSPPIASLSSFLLSPTFATPQPARRRFLHPRSQLPPTHLPHPIITYSQRTPRGIALPQGADKLTSAIIYADGGLQNNGERKWFSKAQAVDMPLGYWLESQTRKPGREDEFW